MKNRSALFFYFILAGLLLTSQITRAQQPSDGDSRNKAAEMKCRTPVTVTGAVRAPIRVEMRRRVRLIELLAAAGGLTERAGKTVEIKRAGLGVKCDRRAPDDVNKKPGSVEVYELDEVKRGSENANPSLHPGDSVTIPEVGVAYITGRVANPQRINLKESTTVLQAIAIVGGVLPDAMIERVRIIRVSPVGDSITSEIVVDLKAIKKGRAKDVVLQPYDIVEVPGKGGGHPWPRPYLKPQSTEMKEKALLFRIIY
jgi:polysaccharide biosynthesis/export protein